MAPQTTSPTASHGALPNENSSAHEAPVPNLAMEPEPKKQAPRSFFLPVYVENPRYPWSNGKEEIVRRGLGLSGSRRHGRLVLFDEKLRIGGGVPELHVDGVGVEPRDAVLRAAGVLEAQAVLCRAGARGAEWSRREETCAGCAVRLKERTEERPREAGSG